MIKQFIKDTPFGLSILLLALAVGFIALIAPVGGNKALIVRSGSMQPTIAVGDLITAKPQQEYKVGDIVAFKDPLKSSVLVTHRIIGQEVQNGKIYFKTKGDGNENADFNLVSKENVIGRADISIKGIGKLLAFTKTNTGFGAIVIFPALLVIVFEIINIFKEIKKQKAISGQQSLKNPETQLIGPMIDVLDFSSLQSRNRLRFKFLGLRVLLPLVLGTLLVYSTFAFLLDSEISTGNVFTAADSFPQIVINEIYYRVDQSHRFGSEAESEWAELYNPTASPKNLTGWSIEDNTSCDNIPGSPIIPAGGFAIVTTTDETTFRTVWTAVPSGVIFITSPTAIGNGLANNDELMLRDGVCGSGSIVDHVSWGANTNGLNPSVPSVPSDGISIERNPDGTDTDTNADFVQSSPPTPGS